MIAPSRTRPDGNPAGYGQPQAGGISEDDRRPPTIPESTKISLGQRLRERQQARWPALATVHLRFRGQFAYVDGELPDQQRLPLCRLRYGGSASRWGFAIYLASRDGYEDSILPTGLHAGSPEEALDCACGLYLNDPTAWQDQRPPASP